MTDEREHLREFLANRDIPCPACGYNLRQLASNLCPECGLQLELTVRLSEPRQGLLIAGLIGLSMGAGMSGFLLLYGLLMMLMHGTPSAVHRFFLINGGEFLVSGTAIALWLRYWRSILRLNLSKQRLLVIGCYALSIGAVVVFALFIR